MRARPGRGARGGGVSTERWLRARLSERLASGFPVPVSPTLAPRGKYPASQPTGPPCPTCDPACCPDARARSERRGDEDGAGRPSSDGGRRSVRIPPIPTSRSPRALSARWTGLEPKGTGYRVAGAGLRVRRCEDRTRRADDFLDSFPCRLALASHSSCRLFCSLLHRLLVNVDTRSQRWDVVRAVDSLTGDA